MFKCFTPLKMQVSLSGLLDLTFYWRITIALFIKQFCNPTDDAFWNPFINKYNTTFHFIICTVSYIKTQVDFFKISMKRKTNPFQLCIKKMESHKTYVTLSIIGI